MSYANKRIQENTDKVSDDVTDDELEEFEEQRRRLHEVTQETRFNLIQTILMHPKQLPSLEEVVFMHPDHSRATLREHLESLDELGIVAKVRLPKEQQSRDYPKVFYGLSNDGREILDDLGLLDVENTLQYLYQNMEKPERIQQLEEAPRPRTSEDESDDEPVVTN